MNCSTFRTHWVNYTDLFPESADLPRQCMLPEKPVLSIQMLEDHYALEIICWTPSTTVMLSLRCRRCRAFAA